MTPKKKTCLYSFILITPNEINHHVYAYRLFSLCYLRDLFSFLSWNYVPVPLYVGGHGALQYFVSHIFSTVYLYVYGRFGPALSSDETMCFDRVSHGDTTFTSHIKLRIYLRTTPAVYSMI